MKVFKQTDSIGSVRKFIYEEGGVQQGGHCPGCGQRVQLYKRYINSSIALSLIALYKHEKTLQRGEYTHWQSFYKQSDLPASVSSQVTSSKYWGLLEKKNSKKDDGNPDSGFWRLTTKGELFVEGALSVPKSLYVFADKIFDETEEKIYIKDALKKHFNYTELMEGL